MTDEEDGGPIAWLCDAPYIGFPFKMLRRLWNWFWDWQDVGKREREVAVRERRVGKNEDALKYLEDLREKERTQVERRIMFRIKNATLHLHDYQLQLQIVVENYSLYKLKVKNIIWSADFIGGYDYVTSLFKNQSHPGSLTILPQSVHDTLSLEADVQEHRIKKIMKRSRDQTKDELDHFRGNPIVGVTLNCIVESVDEDDDIEFERQFQLDKIPMRVTGLQG